MIVEVDMELEALTKEMLPLTIPVKMTVYPPMPSQNSSQTEYRPFLEEFQDKDLENEMDRIKRLEIESHNDFLLYARTLSNLSDDEKRQLVREIAMGTARLISSDLKAEEIRSDKHKFTNIFVKEMRRALQQRGINMGNVNIANIKDKKETR